MENLAPPLELMMEVRFSMEKGIPVKKAIQTYIDQASQQEKEQNKDKNKADKWREALDLWIKALETNKPTDKITSTLSITRRHCLDVLGRGIKGESIYSQVCALEDEIFRSSQMELDEFIATLPIKSLIPLLFFQFPALILILVGPLLSSFFNQ